MRAEGKHPYTKRTPTRCRGHSEERKSSNVLRRLTRSPRLRTICRVVAYARRNPARMNRHIISEFGRMAPKCSLICGKMRGGFPKQGDALRVRTPAAARDLRKNHEKAAERKERQHPHERQLEAGFFSIQETTWPQGFPPWGQEGAPQQKEAQLCRESRVTRASRRRWGRASR